MNYKIKSAIILISLIPSFLLAQTNVYHPFPDSNAVWRESSGGYQSINCTDYQYTINGDTVIGKYLYHKIRKSGVEYYEDYLSGYCTHNIRSSFGYHFGAYREDTNSKQLFYRSPNSSSDTLLYNFNLKLGDSLPSSFGYDKKNSQCINYVSSVDSFFSNNTYRKRFGISCKNLQTISDYAYLIEGIGSTLGLFGQIEPPFERGTKLQCFKQNNAILYTDPYGSYDSTEACKLITGIKKESFGIRKSITIYPNPVTNISTFEINNYLNEYETLEIYNVLGVKVHAIAITRNETSLSKSDLSTGCYLYKLIYNNHVNFETGKFIIE